jgi:DNA-binding MarR family transcriptional regulator
MAASPRACADELLDVLPRIMRQLGGHWRAVKPADLTVAQFRMLKVLHHQPSASLSQVAEHIGMPLPAASKLLESLVERQLVRRQAHGTDRRKLVLELTPHGTAILAQVRLAATDYLSGAFREMPAPERAMVLRALGALRQAFDGTAFLATKARARRITPRKLPVRFPPGKLVQGSR